MNTKFLHIGNDPSSKANVLKASLAFAARRISNRWHSQLPRIDTLVIDIDRTLTKEDSTKIALSHLYGRQEADRIMHSTLERFQKGEMSMNQAAEEVFYKLYAKGFKPEDWENIMEIFRCDSGFRMHLIDVLLEFKSRNNLTMAVATRASRTSADWVAKTFGFDFGIGSEESIEAGTFKGFNVLIGVEDAL